MDKGYADGSPEEALVLKLQAAFFIELQQLLGVRAVEDLPYFRTDPDRAFKAFIPFFIAYERASSETGVAIGTVGEALRSLRIEPGKAN